MKKLAFILLLFVGYNVSAQDYFFKDKAPFDAKIPTPESF